METITTIISLLSRYGMMFVKGTGVTLYMAFLTVLFGAILGSLICLARRVNFAPLRWVAAAYVEVIRGTPMLLQITLSYLTLPELLHMDIQPLYCVILALILNSAAYVSEIIRAGIQAVDVGQAEAARSLGLSSSMTMREIILPQAIKNILPALCNEFIMIVKDSSLGSTFFVGELMTVQATIKGALYLTLEPLMIVAMIYFCLTFTLSKGVVLLERRMSRGD
ncbi:amino acid ABC transporter permease [Merdimmobilis hominis]|jgi:His/Glu/Gln/Arg/opine family amino acid ABC transporter permease subunit|uniref:Arginine transport system permease protein ArtQ n=1 Tax=uncultured Anaerotruncus sp. TaxID=905011 RepID=A0A6N2QUI2_9FIRM|nr:amino acid ABC transporter permease [Merdimmobilis hominis]MCD4836891.1 amino acid ABC transporter permease [Merdimmobilis hominis]